MDRLLEPVDMKSLELQISTFEHPLLEPIAFDLADGLSPDEAGVMAVLMNPALRAERDKVGVAAAQLLQAGILPNPQMTASLDQPFAGTTEGTFTGWGLGLDYDLSALITRDADVAAARADQASISLSVAWAEWQAAQAARMHAVRLIWMQREFDEVSAAETRAGQNAESVGSALQQGLVTHVESDAADTEWQRFRIAVLDTAAAIEAERLALNLAIGLPAATTLQIQATDLATLVPEASPKEIGAALEAHRLDLIALRRGYESQEAKVRGAVLSQFPKISVGVAAARDTSNVISIGPSVTLELPIFDRAQGRIAIEEASRQQLFDEYVARSFEARSDVARLRSELAAVAEKINATDAYIARLERLRQTYSEAVRRGDADVLNLYQVQNTLADTKLEALHLRQDQAELLVGLEVAQGQILARSTP